MSESTTNKQRVLLSTQENVENNPNKNSSLTKQEKIEGTPFTLIYINDIWFTAMGDNRITEPTETKEEQIQKLESEKWLIITNMIIIICKKLTQNPVIMEMDDNEIENNKKEWESPRDREKRTRQEYNPKPEKR